jgi:hypothetical protein
MGRARHGIGGLARRIRPVGRLAVGNLPDGRGHLVATGGHLQRQVLHMLRFDTALRAPSRVRSRSTTPCGRMLPRHQSTSWTTICGAGSWRSSSTSATCASVSRGFHDDRRQLLDIFAQRTSKNELLSAVSAAFADLADWDYRVVWGETFRGAPVLANLGIPARLRGLPRTRRLLTGHRPRARWRGRRAHPGQAGRVCRSYCWPGPPGLYQRRSAAGVGTRAVRRSERRTIGLHSSVSRSR